MGLSEHDPHSNSYYGVSIQLSFTIHLPLIMPGIHFFAEKDIPYLKDYFKNWGTWREFSSIGELAQEVEKGVVPDLQRTVFFIKTSTRFDSSWEVLGPLLKKIRIIGSAAVGVDHIEFAYLKKKQIVFYNSPGCNSSAVTDYVIYLIFKYCFIQKRTLPSLTISILGLGNIGSRLAKTLQDLGIQTIAYDPWINTRQRKIRNLLKGEPNLTLSQNLKEFFSHPTDVITLHIPLVNTGPHPTYHILDSHALKQIEEFNRKKRVLIINSSRGGVVEEKAILPYLKKKTMDYAADVWEEEPYLNPKITKYSLYISPHIAGYTHRAKQQAATILFNRVASNLEKKGWITGKIAPQISPLPKKRLPVINQGSSIENTLYHLLNRITGLDEMDKELRKILSHRSPSARASGFIELRRRSLREEIRDYHVASSKKEDIQRVVKILMQDP